MPPKLQLGDRLIIKTTSNETFFGSATCIMKDRIQINNIIYKGAHMSENDTMTFFRNEIEKITRVSDPEPEEGQSISSNAAFAGEVNDMKITLNEYRRLKEVTKNYMYIDRENDDFFNAIDALLDSHSLGIASVGNNSNYEAPISLLIICNYKQVYIFDMNCLKIDKIKPVLESEDILKVVHDIRPLYYCLYHQFNIEMQNIYDLKIGDSIRAEKDNVNKERDLSECFELYLNIRKTLLETAVEDSLNDSLWTYRPLSESQKLEAGMLVVYLIPIYNFLMDLNLKEHNEIVEKEYRQFESMTDVEMMKKVMVEGSLKKMKINDGFTNPNYC